MIKPTKEFLEVFKNTNGALSVAESVAIMNSAAQAPEGNYMELGTYKGKSAISAALSLKKGVFYLVEPEFKTMRHDEVIDIISKIRRFNTHNIAIASIPDYSINVIDDNDWYSYVFVDSGSHQDGLPMQEVKLLEDKIVPHGIIAFHDYKSQFIEVEEAYNYLLSTDKYEEINIDWNEIIEYVNENNLEEANQSWHHAELKNPCFVGALRRK